MGIFITSFIQISCNHAYYFIKLILCDSLLLPIPSPEASGEEVGGVNLEICRLPLFPVWERGRGRGQNDYSNLTLQTCLSIC